MATDQEKLKQFMTAIDAYVEEQSEKLRREVEQHREERLRAAEEEVLTTSQQLIRTENEALKLQMSHEIARREAQARQALLQSRAAIADRVFTEAEARVVAFTATEAYTALRRRMLDGAAAALPQKGTVFFVRPADLPAAEQYARESGKSLQLRADDRIRIGGVRAENRLIGRAVDDTL